MNIFILPSNNKNNAYIDLLIKSLEEKGLKSLNIFRTKKDTVLEVFNQIVFNKIKRDRNVIHIQWSTIIYGSKYLLKSLSALFLNVILICILKWFFGTKIVWTVHNNFAHDYKHRRFDLFGMRTLIHLSDAIVVQQKSTLAQFKNKYSDKNIHYLPHPNYIDVYGSVRDRNFDLRRSFGFEDGDIVLLSLGAIKKYKKNEEIIKAVSVNRVKIPELKLLIIGKGDKVYVDSLNSWQIMIWVLLLKIILYRI